jgi:hypothetical protein
MVQKFQKRDYHPAIVLVVLMTVTYEDVIFVILNQGRHSKDRY